MTKDGGIVLLGHTNSGGMKGFDACLLKIND